MKQNSFILYHDMWDQLKELSNEERWKILEAIFVYHSTWEILSMDRMLNIVFISIRSMLDRDREKYDEYIEKQSENGRKGWRPKKSDANPENPPVILETHWNPTKPKKADSASASVSVSPSESPSATARDIVSTETKIIKNEYQENISFMKRQAENINNWVSPDIPDFVQEVHEEAWAKFLLYWTSPTKSWKLLCDDTKQKSFDIKRRFVTWIWNNTATSSYSQPKKTTIWYLNK